MANASAPPGVQIIRFQGDVSDGFVALSGNTKSELVSIENR